MQKVRYGVIGINGVGKYHIRFARENEHAELAAVADINEASAKRCAAEIGSRAFADYRDMLDAGIVDAVSIAVPHYLHAPIALDCLNAGVHVFIEKPLADRVSEADAVIAAAKKNNLKLCVCHQYRTFHSSQILKRIIDSGRIGNILRVLWTWFDFRPECYYDRDQWRATWRGSGGGTLMNQASHDLDLICWLIGKPEQVSAMLGRQIHKPEIEDIACAEAAFSNGAFGSFQFSINQPRAYSIRQIVGESGMVILQDVKSLTDDRNDSILVGTYRDDIRTAAAKIKDIHEQPEILWELIKAHPDQPLLKRALMKFPILRRFGSKIWKDARKPIGIRALMNGFIESVRNDSDPPVTGESALAAVELINAMTLSAMRRKTVDLPLDRVEYDELFKELCSGKTRIQTFG